MSPTADPSRDIGSSPFGDLDALVRRLTSGQFEVAALGVLSPFITALITGWAAAAVIGDATSWSTLAAYAVATVAAGLALAIHQSVPLDWQPVVAILAAVGASAAMADGLAPIVVPASVGIVVAASIVVSDSTRARLTGDRCILVVPACTAAVMSVAAGRLEGWTASRLGAALGITLLALVTGRIASLYSRVGLLGLPIGALELPLFFGVFGWDWTRIAITTAAAATISCIVFLGAYHAVIQPIVDSAVTRQLVTAMRSSSDHLYDELHETVLNRLGVTMAVARMTQATAVNEELLEAEAEVRAFRASAVAAPQSKIYDVLDAASRRYRAVLDVDLPEAPADTALPMDFSDAKHLQWIANELLSNAAKYATVNRTKASVSVRSQIDHHGLSMVIQDDGPGLAAVPARGVLAKVVAETNARDGWRLEHVPAESGATFILTIRRTRKAAQP